VILVNITKHKKI